MTLKRIFPLLIFLIFAFTACSGAGSATPDAVPTDTSLPVEDSASATTQSATELVPTTPPVSTDAAPVTAGNALSDPVSSNFIDDRSTPSQVIVSFFNAINRQEYARAYGYYQDGLTSLGDYNAFASGYASTTSVALTFGQISSDAGAGNFYFTVPVILTTSLSGGTTTRYAACYIVHQTNPDNYGAPPFKPMGIDQGQATVMADGTSDADGLTGACAGLPSGGNPAPARAESLDISRSNFIDNRSSAIELVSSLLNAINLKQYVRAYSYFDGPSAYPGAYETYADGFANTDSITALFGTVEGQGAAGSIYYSVPLAEVVHNNDSNTQTFVGCYTVRLTQPGNYANPPVNPMGITAGNFILVENGADLNALLVSACSGG